MASKGQENDSPDEGPTAKQVIAVAKAFDDAEREKYTKELLKATKLKRKEDEEPEVFTRRVAKAAEAFAEDDWNSLSKEAQAWVNAIVVTKKPKPLPAVLFTADEKGDEDETEADETEASEDEQSEDEEETEGADESTDEEDEKVTTKSKKAAASKGGRKTETKPAKKTVAKSSKAAKPEPKTAKKASKANGSLELREGSKNAKLLGLVERKEGATMEQMLKATGWEKEKSVHSVLSGVFRGKMGLTVEYKDVKGKKTYFAHK